MERAFLYIVINKQSTYLGGINEPCLEIVNYLNNIIYDGFICTKRGLYDL